MLLEHQKCKE